MNYTQENRVMEVTTPLGKDVLLLVGFTGYEKSSPDLFSFQLDLFAENLTIKTSPSISSWDKKLPSVSPCQRAETFLQRHL